MFIINHKEQLKTSNDKINSLSANMHWMKHALFEWSKAVEEGGEANALIEKYCKDDTNKAKVSQFMLVNEILKYFLFRLWKPNEKR